MLIPEIQYVSWLECTPTVLCASHKYKDSKAPTLNVSGGSLEEGLQLLLWSFKSFSPRILFYFLLSGYVFGVLALTEFQQFSWDLYFNIVGLFKYIFKKIKILVTVASTE